MRYAELHCHTNFSFLDGASHPEDLVERAVEQLELDGQEAAAVSSYERALDTEREHSGAEHARTGEATRRVTMRNEISASANKIYPNNGLWFNEPSTCQPGQTVTTNGVNYELGVVNKGFDNDGDGDVDIYVVDGNRYEIGPDGTVIETAQVPPLGADAWRAICDRFVGAIEQVPPMYSNPARRE